MSNQHKIVQFSGAYNNARIIISSVSHETANVSVDISCSSTGQLVSSHSKPIDISQPRYSGLVAY